MCPLQRDFLDSFTPPGDSRCRWRSSLSVYLVSCRTHCPAELGNLTGEPSTSRSSFAHNSFWHGVLKDKENSDVAEEGREFKAMQPAGGQLPWMRSRGLCSLRVGRGCER